MIELKIEVVLNLLSKTDFEYRQIVIDYYKTLNNNIEILNVLAKQDFERIFGKIDNFEEFLKRLLESYV